MVLDMLSVLIHGTLVSENSEKGGEENKKTHTALIRKLKVLSEKRSDYMHTASLGRRDGLISAQVTTSSPSL